MVTERTQRAWLQKELERSVNIWVIGSAAQMDEHAEALKKSNRAVLMGHKDGGCCVFYSFRYGRFTMNPGEDIHRMKNEILLECDTLKFLVPSEREHYLSFFAVFFAGEYDDILKIVKPSDIVLDAGAHMGFFSVSASKRARRVISVEPVQLHYTYLTRNITMNNIRNIVPVNVALSGYAGHSCIREHGTSSKLSSAGKNVEITTPVTLLKRLPCSRVDIIKMDIEGEETEALSSFPLEPVRGIVVEAHGKENENCVVELLEKENFSVSYWKYSPKRKIMVSVKNLDDLIRWEFRLKAPLFWLGFTQIMTKSCTLFQNSNNSNLKTIIGMKKNV